MDPAECEHAFEVYFAEIARCIKTRCYWALLHLLVILPDICASLETDDGEANDGGYRNWCKRYFSGDKKFTPGDRYAIRCALLHEGRTVTKRGQYGSYSFVQPTETGDVLHRIVTDFGRANKPNLTLDVGEMAQETVQAIHRWLDDLQNPVNTIRLKNVLRHLPQLVRMGPKTIPGVEAVRIYAVSSTGSIENS